MFRNGLAQLGMRAPQQQVHNTYERWSEYVSVQDYWEMHDKLVIAPYVAGSSDVAKPLLGFKTAITPIKERKTLLYLTASCLPYAYENWNQTKIKGGKVCTASCLSL